MHTRYSEIGSDTLFLGDNDSNSYNCSTSEILHDIVSLIISTHTLTPSRPYQRHYLPYSRSNHKRLQNTNASLTSPCSKFVPLHQGIPTILRSNPSFIHIPHKISSIHITMLRHPFTSFTPCTACTRLPAPVTPRRWWERLEIKCAHCLSIAAPCIPSRRDECADTRPPAGALLVVYTPTTSVSAMAARRLTLVRFRGGGCSRS